MHVILGITSYERDIKEVKKYLEGLKEVEYLKKVKIINKNYLKELNFILFTQFLKQRRLKKLGM